VLWSTVVQHGKNTKIASNVITSLGRNASDSAIITAIYNERGKTDSHGTLVHFKNSSKKIQDGIKNRYKNELKRALIILKK
jgi:hypothetical protein